jgi:hypothetical protein
MFQNLMTPDRRKTQAINLRMSPSTKALLRAAAERDHRTLSNLLELLILEHCQKHGIEVPPDADGDAGAPLVSGKPVSPSRTAAGLPEAKD